VETGMETYQGILISVWEFVVRNWAMTTIIATVLATVAICASSSPVTSVSCSTS